MSSITPKINIVDSSITYSKTFTVDLSHDENHTSSKSLQSTGGHCNSHALDQPCSIVSQNSGKDGINGNNHGVKAISADTNYSKKNNALTPMKVQPKKSFMRSIFGRLSHHKGRRSDVPMKHAKCDLIDTNRQEVQLQHKSPEISSKVRRWLSKRVLRSKIAIPGDSYASVTEGNQTQPLMQDPDSVIAQTDLAKAERYSENRLSSSLEILDRAVSNTRYPGTLDSSNTCPTDGSDYCVCGDLVNNDPRHAKLLTRGDSLRSASSQNDGVSCSQNNWPTLAAPPCLSDSRLVLKADAESNTNYVPSYLNISVAAFGYSHRPYGDSQSMASPLTTAVGKSDNPLSPSKFTYRDASAPQILHSICTPSISAAIRSPQLSSAAPPSGGKQSVLQNTRKSDPQPSAVDSCSSPPQVDSTNNVTAQVDSDPISIKVVPPDKDNAETPPPTSYGTVKLRRSRTRSQTGGGPPDDRNHWQRSSLIMLAVSHASPRVRPLTTVLVPSTLGESAVVCPGHSPRPYSRQHSGELDKRLLDGRSLYSSTVEVDLRPVIDVNGEESMTSAAHDQSCLATSGTANTTGSEQTSQQTVTVTVPWETGSGELSGAGTTANVSPLAMDSCAGAGAGPLPNHHQQQKPTDVDGHSFLRQVDQVEAELWAEILATEADLERLNGLSDEVYGVMRAAAGKARLLVTDKFAQFRGLCQQNLEWMARLGSRSQSETTDGDHHGDVGDGDQQLVTLVSDLDGFWAVVSLQVADVRLLFNQVARLREADWRLPDGDAGHQDTVLEPVVEGRVASGAGVGRHKKTGALKKREAKSRPSTGAVRPQAGDDVQRAKAHERLQLFKQSLQQAKSFQSSPDAARPDDIVPIFV